MIHHHSACVHFQRSYTKRMRSAPPVRASRRWSKPVARQASKPPPIRLVFVWATLGELQLANLFIGTWKTCSLASRKLVYVA